MLSWGDTLTAQIHYLVDGGRNQPAATMMYALKLSEKKSKSG